MIVFPMAGLSRRFAEAGYRRPKYMLALGQETVFDRVITGFSRYFTSEPFVFIVRDLLDTADFVAQRCTALGIRRFEIVTLPGDTAGQAETVALGLDGIKAADEDPVTIFNIDTFRPAFSYPAQPWFSSTAGYLEVFSGSGANWSYVRPAASGADLVAEVAEKRPISDLCCTGLYYFRTAGDFRWALAREREAPSSAELYVAPLYNHLIGAGRSVHYHRIAVDEVTFCGVPAEYWALGGAPAE